MMSKKQKTKYNDYSYRNYGINNPVTVWIMAVLGIAVGIFFIVSQSDNKPIPREQAVAYTGYFDHYEAYSDNYRTIYFTDGSCYNVYAHTETQAFRDKMLALEKGIELSVLVNPNNGYVAEITTGTQELLNFEQSQQAIDNYDNGYIGIGIFMCVAGSLLIIYQIMETAYKRKEKSRRKQRVENKKSGILRYVDPVEKSRILLEATVQQYHICYRRVKSVNELVINGRVYDEKKGIFEFEHQLCALVDGHSIKVGMDDQSHSYILFDGDIIKRKKRLI